GVGGDERGVDRPGGDPGDDAKGRGGASPAALGDRAKDARLVSPTRAAAGEDQTDRGRALHLWVNATRYGNLPLAARSRPVDRSRNRVDETWSARVLPFPISARSRPSRAPPRSGARSASGR